MRRRSFLAGTVAALAAGGVGRGAAAAEPLTVAATTYPLAYFAERIGGDAVRAYFPAPPDRDPAFWRPSIAEIAEYQQADLILLNGGGYAAWTARTTLPRSRTVDASRGFRDRFIETETITHSHGADGEHSHRGVATHVWLDFALAAKQARAVAERLSRARPETADAFAAGLAALEADLAALDAEAEAVGSALAGVRIVTSHPRYQYFARAYGLEVASLEWDAAEDPDAADLEALDALIADGDGTGVFIFEAEPSEAARDGVEARGLRVAVLPPAARRPATGDFLSVMRAGLADLSAAASER